MTKRLEADIRVEIRDPEGAPDDIRYAWRMSFTTDETLDDVLAKIRKGFGRVLERVASVLKERL